MRQPEASTNHSMGCNPIPSRKGYLLHQFLNLNRENINKIMLRNLPEKKVGDATSRPMLEAAVLQAISRPF